MPPRRIRDEDIGLKVLIDKYDAREDIVAVHGRGAHPDDTWCELRKEGMDPRDGANYINWLNDETMLPHVVPTARIMRYGYHSAWFGDEKLFTSPREISSELLQALKEERASCPRRPLIVIAHSFGGLVVMQMLLKARDQYPEIYTSITGLIFFGTPFRGSDARSQEILIGLAHERQYATNETQLATSGVGSEYLKNLFDDFRQALRDSVKPRTACFYEQKETNISATVDKQAPTNYILWVDERAATIDNIDSAIQNHPRSCDHFKLNKFRNASLSEFKTLTRTLQDMVEKGPALIRDRRAANTQGTFWLVPFRENSCFTGRHKELDVLKRKLLVDKDCNKMALVGLGGAGKTQIALSFAYIVKETWPEYSIFWLPALSMEAFEQACREVAQKLGLIRDEENQEDVKSLVKQELDNWVRGKWLLIVDNADNPELVWGKEQSYGIMNYLPESESGLIVFTTRSADVAQSTCSSDIMDIEGMEKDDAIGLLQRLVARKEHCSNLTATEDLLDELTYLPLAISQASAYINTRKVSVQGYLKLIKSTEQKLVEMMSFELDKRHKDAARAVATTWIVSFEAIQENEQTAADMLAFLSCIEWKAIPHSILPASSSGVESDIGVLCSYSFVTRREDEDQYDMHRLVHLATRVWLGREKRTAAVKTEAIKHLALIFPNADYGNQDIWRAYLPHAMRTNRDAEISGIKSLLCLKIGQCLGREGRIREATQFCRDSYQWTVRLEDTNRLRLSTEHVLALAYLANGQVDKAVQLLERVAVICKKLPEDHPNRLSLQHVLASAYLANGQVNKVVQLLERVVVIYKKLPEDHPDRLSSQRVLASANLANGQVDKAVQLLERVVVTCEKLPEDHPYRLVSQHALASAYLRDRQVDKAVQLLERVVVAYKKLPEDHPYRLALQHQLAVAYLRDRQVDKAVQLLERVVAIQEKLAEDHPDRLSSQHALASAYHKNGRIKEAIDIMIHVVRRKQLTQAAEHPSRLESERLLKSLVDGQERSE